MHHQFAGTIRRFAVEIVPAENGDPPTRARIFQAGINRSENGDFLFDEIAAEQSLAHAIEHGVLKMVDLEHLSLNSNSPNFDPDARAWFTYAVENGEGWMDNIRWTADGIERVKSGRQRYFSPTVFLDDAGRVEKLVNVALTALPAMWGAPALAARLGGTMGLQKNAIDTKTLQAVVKAIGGDPAADLGALIATVVKFVDELKAAATGTPAKDEEKPSEPTEPASDPMAPAANRIMKLAGVDNIVDAVQAIETWNKSHLELAQSRAKLEDDRKALELADRRKLVGDLVKLGVELPATAWADATALVPSPHLASMPLEDLRKRVETFSAIRGTTTRVESARTSDLTDRELEILRASGRDNDQGRVAYLQARNSVRRNGASK